VAALRQAWRSLARSPWFAAGAAATFALGIGINVAVFASVDRLLFRPLPYRDPDRLFLLQMIDVESGQRVSLPTRYVVEARSQLGIIDDLAVLGDSTGYFMTPEGDGPEVRVSLATSRMLDVAGVRPIKGRGFTEDDDRFERRVVVLTHEGWQARFAGDPGVVGRRIWYRENSLEVIGVLPPGYIVPGTFIDPNISGIGLMPAPNFTTGGLERTLPPTLRLRAGVSREAAQQAIDALVERLRPEMPPVNGVPPRVQLVPIRDAMFGRYYQYLWLVVAGAVLVLVIACANLAGLFLVRGRSRVQDAAVRLSLGASRRHLVVDAMAEGALVCLGGTVAALLALRWSAQWLDSVLPPIFSRFSAGADARVVTAALATAVVASIAAAVLPALLVGRHQVWEVVQGGTAPLGGGSPRRGRWLLAVEAAIGVVLVAASAVTARNLSGMTSDGLGFDPQDLQLLLVRSLAKTSPDRYADMDQALAIVREETNVVSAAGAPMLPVLRTGSAPFAANGPPCCRWQITGDYVSTVGVPLVAGRAISDADVRTQTPVAMLNQTGLRHVWPGVAPGEAIGRPLALEGEPAREVIGIVGDTRRGYDDDFLPGIYVPVVTDPFNGMLIVARTRPGAPVLFSRIRPRLEMSSRREIYYVRPLPPMYGRVLEAPRFRAALFGAFGAVALIIAMVGLYALTSFSVVSRRRELGVRIALGASRRAVVGMVLVDTAKPVLVGVVAGIGLALWAGPLLQSFLFRFSARDPWSLGAAALALVASSALAAWMPARRASRVDPVVVLKSS
jgi:putative ABC transport system permease protein